MKHAAQWCFQQRTGPSLGRFPSQLWKIYSTPPNGKRGHLLVSNARHCQLKSMQVRYYVDRSHFPVNPMELATVHSLLLLPLLQCKCVWLQPDMQKATTHLKLSCTDKTIHSYFRFNQTFALFSNSPKQLRGSTLLAV